jgi:hypothetical protein
VSRLYGGDFSFVVVLFKIPDSISSFLPNKPGSWASFLIHNSHLNSIEMKNSFDDLKNHVMYLKLSCHTEQS